MKDIKLNPCPICKGEAILDNKRYDYGCGYRAWIGCKNRCHSHPLFPCYQAIALYVPDEWNSRTHPDWKKHTEFVTKGLISWWNNWATADFKACDADEDEKVK